MKITGNHSIVAASLNPMRRKKIFFGLKSLYDKLSLNCEFRKNNTNYLEVDELFVESTLQDFLNHDKVILLDGLMNPRNIGAIIRTAAAMGFFVLLRKHRGCPINETVVESASGGIEYIKVLSVANIDSILKKFQQNDFWCIGLHETGKQDIEQYEFPKKTLIVIGEENKGISKICQDYIDNLVVISTEKFSTLNASVAAAIAMYSCKINKP